MKIKNKIGLLFFLIVIIIVVIFMAVSQFLRENYKDIKFNVAYEYNNTHNLTANEYAKYLTNKGFIVTDNKFNNYQNLICHEGEIVGYDGDVPVFYATINENIINDFLMLLDYILGGILISIMFLIIIFYYIFNKLVLKRVVNLEKNISSYNINTDLEKVYQNIKIDKYKDEITSLEVKFKNMLMKIDLNEKEKQKLIMALSHELKNPICKIEAILQMYSVNFEGYDKKEIVIKLIDEEINNMSTNINNLLEFYKSYKGEEVFQLININEKIKNIFSDSMFENRQITFKIKEEDEIIVKTIPDKLDIIFNNIKSNIYNYAKENKMVFITINTNEIIIENEINKNKVNSTKVGNIINDYLAKSLGLKIKYNKQNERYITQISF